jgi:hypothetical protein
MTKILRFSVGKKHDKKVSEAMDKWAKRNLSQSSKVCDAIIKLHEEEERGSKITAFNGQQSKLPLLPPVYEIPVRSDLEGLTYDELRTIFSASHEWLALSKKMLEMMQKQR